jgi:hypothetical protein
MNEIREILAVVKKLLTFPCKNDLAHSCKTAINLEDFSFKRLRQLHPWLWQILHRIPAEADPTDPVRIPSGIILHSSTKFFAPGR